MTSTFAQHEDGSKDMFDHMLKVNKPLRKKFDDYGLGDSDILFIKEQIAGPNTKAEDESSQETADWKYKGRRENMSFLYEVIIMLHTLSALVRTYQYKLNCHNPDRVQQKEWYRCRQMGLFCS